MSAAAAVVLSSSPPRIFARSPTSIDSSPSLPSPSELFKFDSENRYRFLPAKKARDSFSNDFKSTRTLLGTKKGAENVPFRSPGREKFKFPEPEALNRSRRFILNKSRGRALSDLLNGGSPVLPKSKPLNEPKEKPPGSRDAAGEVSVAEDTRLASVQDATSRDGFTLTIQAERALPRRTDWTPPKERNRSPVDSHASPSLERAETFPEDLLRNFSFEGEPCDEMGPRQSIAISNGVTKRQRIELVAGLAEGSGSRSRMPETKIPNQPVGRKRTKSPAKKTMTITKLATSNYFGQENAQKESPMMQYLSATQARTMDDDFEDTTGSSRAPNSSKQKRNPQKPRKQKSKLRSPQSALKAMGAQETVFGSASQLARDEEAVSTPRNEPLWTQQTHPISIESTTPRTGRGTSRFAKTRNLWGIAARDDDNALLHVDSIDLFDTPDVRVAFAGKDVLLEPNSMGDSRLCVPNPATHRVADVDEFDSPLLRTQPSKSRPTSSRSFHTSNLAQSPSKPSKDTKSQTQEKQAPEGEGEKNAASKPSKSAPEKPSYAGLTTHDLQKQLSSFGFKPVKKREKMIELLEKCWEEKHGKEDPALKHGDFLSKVHDVSSRPQPKVKKPRKPAKDENAEAEASSQRKPRKRVKDDKAEGEVSPQKTTKRQKKTPQADEEQEAPKKVRKRKTKTTVVCEPNIMDIDEVESPRDGARGKKAAKVDKSIRDITPPPSRPAQAPVEGQNLGRSQIDASETDLQKGKAETAATPSASADSSIGRKIQAAILRQSDDDFGADRNHQREPTWHEKILQYDPIILEDLTVWLNTQGLNFVNEDREVSPIEVRDWCETNSICCLWKGGWRGQKVKGAED